MSETQPHPPIAARPRRPVTRRTASPYWTDTASGRAESAGIRWLVAWFGTHLICPLKPCGRAGRCREDDPRRLPFCFDHHRGSIRFALMLTMARGVRPDARGDAVAAGDDETGDRPLPPRTGPSVLGVFAAEGAPIAGLRRPVEAGRDTWDWECDAEAVALMARVKARAAAEAQG